MTTNTTMRYDRRLPHFDVIGQRVFVTFRFYGSLPQSRMFPNTHLTSGQAFVAMDRLLDSGKRGPLFLNRPEIAAMVVQTILDGDRSFKRYDLHAWIVMPNHVHMLVTSHVPLRDWLRSLKGFTGHKAVRMLGLSTPFWQDENYDHVVRNDEESQRVKRYIEWNPVKAGLATTPEKHPYSSAVITHG